MNARTLLFAQFVVVGAVAVAHLSGHEFYLYWRFLWFDMVVHTLGGIWASLFVFWASTVFGYTPKFAWGVAGALVLGAVWEVFEVAAGLPRAANFALDTSIDFLMDAIGGVLGAYFAAHFAKKDEYWQ